MNKFLIGLCLASAMQMQSGRAEELLVKLELASLTLTEAAPAAEGPPSTEIKSNLSDDPRADHQQLELQVESGKSFYAKSRVGDQMLIAKGRLNAVQDADSYELEVELAATEFTGEFMTLPNQKPQELTHTRKVKTQFILKRDTTVQIGGITKVQSTEPSGPKSIRRESFSVRLESIEASE